MLTTIPSVILTLTLVNSRLISKPSQRMQSTGFTRMRWLQIPINFRPCSLIAPSRQERITDSIQVRDSIIQSESSVNILGIDIDEKLTFTSHINTICRKAGRQVNVLRRLSHMLDVESRLAIFKASTTAL